MRVFLISGPGVGAVEEVADPVPIARHVVVDVAYAGICGTDVGLFRPEPRDSNSCKPATR
jgi:threonine dehydrogenase-like Zn-dependent dehydrogenase